MSYRLLDPFYRERQFNLLSEQQSAEEPDPSVSASRRRRRSQDAPPEKPKRSLVSRAISSVGPQQGIDFAKDLAVGGEARSNLGGMLGWNKDTSITDRIQDTLDMVGIIDPTGVADATNALGYLARGKIGDAAIAAAGIVPYLGDLGKIAKWARRGGKVAKTATKTEGRIAKAANIASRKGAQRATKRAAIGTAEKTVKPRFVRRAEVLAKRGMGRHGRTAVKLYTGEGKVRGKVGKIIGQIEELRKTKIGQVVEKTIRDEIKKKPELAAELSDEPVPEPTAEPVSEPSPKEVASTPELQAAQEKKSQRGAIGRTSVAGRPMVPVDSSCPPGDTKTSKHGAPPGMKRCHPQSPQRWH